MRYALALKYGSNELTKGGDICNGKQFCGWFLLRDYQFSLLDIDLDQISCTKSNLNLVMNLRSNKSRSFILGF